MKTRSIMLFENATNKIEFVINPEAITISESVANVRENINSIGEVNLHGKRGLKNISITTFVPGADSPFRAGKSIKEVRNIIDRWLNTEAKLRVIITNPTINFKALLDSASFNLKEGSEDLYITLSLTEYKDMAIPDIKTVQGLINVGGKQATSDKVELENRASETVNAKNEVVNEKTTLWALALKHYGNGSEWKKIAAANGNINPKKLKKGMVLQVP